MSILTYLIDADALLGDQAALIGLQIILFIIFLEFIYDFNNK